MIGDQLAAESFANFAILQKKRARHALDIAGGKTDEVATKCGAEHADYVLAIEVLTDFCARQAESLVQRALRIAEPW
ncbi:MAG TPA: hypothetical protein VOA64_15465 [Candidatus Dormibacteraeota bacterium]|nr:hypothetical protein [Candidatus Dormibacteraeota bacterium]